MAAGFWAGVFGFELTPGTNVRQYGLEYKGVYGGVVDDGSYTFQVTDSVGRSVTQIQDFTYDPTVPSVDSATMSPANYSYVGTTTPTLSFDPVAGAEYYQVAVFDSDGKAVWYVNRPITSTTSFAIPAGLLQPDTAYLWMARVWDSDTDPQNCHLSEVFYFFTGTKDTPQLSDAYVVGWPYYSDTRRSVLVGKPLNLAPWDIQSFNATGPDSTVFDLANLRDWRFYGKNGNSGQLYHDPPTESVPDAIIQLR